LAPRQAQQRQLAIRTHETALAPLAGEQFQLQAQASTILNAGGSRAQAA